MLPILQTTKRRVFFNNHTKPSAQYHPTQQYNKKYYLVVDSNAVWYEKECVARYVYMCVCVDTHNADQYFLSFL